MAKSGMQQLDDLIGELEAITGASTQTAELPAVPKEKKEKVKSAVAAPPSVVESAAKEKEELDVNALDLRVGVIVKVQKHETADKLYCEEIDIGEPEPRCIASGLVPHYTLEEMQNRRLIVIANLPPKKLVGFKSQGMVLCAAKVIDADGKEKVEFIDPPANAKPGDRIVGDGLLAPPLSQKQCEKQKAFEKLAPLLKVNNNGTATWNGVNLVVAGTADACTAPTLRDCIIR